MEGLLSYEYAEEPGKSEVTGFAGLLPYVDLFCVLGLARAADEQVGVCGPQGWLDRQHVLSLVLLNLAGGECAEDVRLLEADAGLGRVFREAECWGLSRSERRDLQRRFRKGRERTFPSATRLREYLEAFHDVEEEAKRVAGKAFIPARNEHLRGLHRVNETLVRSVCGYRPQTQATLDIDATVQETTKREALYCYQGVRAYQPLTVYWAQTGLAVVSEFRDGNVPAGWEILRVLKEALSALPESVERVSVRMDSAGYQHEVLEYCATGDHGRREVIDFTISCDMTPALRAEACRVAEEDWQALYRLEDGCLQRTKQEWAEVVFVPNASATVKCAPYRYLVVRELVEQGVLPGMEGDAQLELDFPTIVCAGWTYRVRGIVTNKEGDGAEVICWHNLRCGRSEEAHAVMKTDLAGGTFPSGKFGANAAWWGMMLLAYNLHAAMRLMVLPGSLRRKRLKALRFALIAVPGRIVEHARRVSVRLARGHPALGWLWEMRAALRGLALAGSG